MFSVVWAITILFKIFRFDFCFGFSFDMIERTHFSNPLIYLGHPVWSMRGMRFERAGGITGRRLVNRRVSRGREPAGRLLAAGSPVTSDNLHRFNDTHSFKTNSIQVREQVLVLDSGTARLKCKICPDPEEWTRSRMVTLWTIRLRIQWTRI